MPIPPGMWTSRPLALAVAAALAVPVLASCAGGEAQPAAPAAPAAPTGQKACAQAANLRAQIADDEEAAAVALDLSATYASRGEATAAEENRTRYLKISAQLFTDSLRLSRLDEACSGS